MPELIAVKSERLQKVIEEVREFAERRGLDPDELVADWLEDKLELQHLGQYRGCGL